MAQAGEGWAAFSSTTVPGAMYLAAAGPQGPWFLALDHDGVIEDVGLTPTAMAGPGLARYSFPTLGALYDVLPRVYALSASLPDAPLQQFAAQVRGLPRTTEAERLVVQRIGQDVFRASLMKYCKAAAPSPASAIETCCGPPTSSRGPSARATRPGWTCIMACSSPPFGMPPLIGVW